MAALFTLGEWFQTPYRIIEDHFINLVNISLYKPRRDIKVLLGLDLTLQYEQDYEFNDQIPWILFYRIKLHLSMESLCLMVPAIPIIK